MRCKKRVVASVPADMPPGTPFGLGLAACQMVSFSRLTEAFESLFGLKISEGALAYMLARSAKPFAAEAEKIADIVRHSPVHRERPNVGACMLQDALAVQRRPVSHLIAPTTTSSASHLIRDAQLAPKFKAFLRKL